MLVDTHTHVNFQPFSSEYKAVIQRALDNDIVINNVGSQWESSQRSVEIANEYATGVWASIGVHPIHLFTDITEEQVIDGATQTIRTRAEKFDYARYKALAQSSNKVVAIGECGLDYLHFERAQIQDQSEELRELQISTFREHVELALELDLAVVIHCRDAARHSGSSARAFEDLLTVLGDYNGRVRGVVHCYTGVPEYIPQFLKLGLYIGYTGIITFNNSQEVQDSLRATPLDRVLLETDAPYLTPVPFRGKRNEPAYVQYVAEAAAVIKQESLVTLSEQTTKNAFELFRFS